MSGFALDMSKFVAKAGKNADQVVRKTASDLFIAIMQGTPKDMGRAQGSWMFSINIPDCTSPINIRSFSETKAEIKIGAKTAPMGSTMWLSNNIAYIEKLEYGLYPNPVKYGSRRKNVSKLDPIKYEVKSIGGFSAQAPQGFVRLNVMKFQTFVNNATRGLK